MYPRGDKRREEHRQHLGVHRAAYFAVVHADLAENVEPRAVVKALAYLLVVHYKHRRQDKYSAEQYSEEKQSAVKSKELLVIACAAFGFEPLKVEWELHVTVFHFVVEVELGILAAVKVEAVVVHNVRAHSAVLVGKAVLIIVQALEV